MKIESVDFKGIEAFRLRTDRLCVTVTPYGAKIQSIRFDGKEYLHQNEESDTYRLSGYGDSFVKGEFSGFDEMFPNISAGPYPDDPWKGARLPDHGEVWSRPWQCRADKTGLSFSIEGVALPYRLEKHLSVDEDQILLRYRAINLSKAPLKCIWAAHPLFVLEDGLTLDLPHCREIVNVYAGRKFLGGYGQRWPWPAVDRGRDLRVLSASHQTSNKYYVAHPMEENRSRLRYPDGTVIELFAPADRVPYLGVWTDEAGEDMACAAPEPCTGAYDAVDRADAENAVCVIDPLGEKEWFLRISFSAPLR